MSKIIIASKLKVYSHILKNNKNAILINPNNTNIKREELKKFLKSNYI